MTPVNFKFLYPDGTPIVGKEFFVTLRKPALDKTGKAVLYPEAIKGITDAAGMATLDLNPSDKSYYMTMDLHEEEHEECCGTSIKYRFLVLPSNVPVNAVDLIISDPTWSQPWDEEALQIILDAKFKSIDAADRAKVSATEAANSAATAVSAAAEAETTIDTVRDLAGQASTSASAAAASAGSASTSAGNSAQSATASANSATQSAAARDRAVQAEANATGASTNAQAANAQAQQAKTDAAGSATAAAQSATSASQQATLANQFATAANASANSASGYNSTAQTAATTATQQATAAGNSAAAAATSATNAAKSASDTAAAINALGTAAKKDAVASNNDTTTGRLISVGWRGVGGSTLPSAADLNAIAINGVEAINDTTANNNPFFTYGTVATNVRGAGERTQMAQSVTSPEVISRHMVGGNWTRWYKVFNQFNIVGTNFVDASGFPTGGIIERGVGSNGEYTRFTDGTQITWGGFASGNVAASTVTAFSGAIPKAYASIGDFRVFALAYPNDNWDHYGVIGASAASASAITAHIRNGATPQSFTVIFFTVGRWR